jgi:hypothetical protein
MFLVREISVGSESPPVTQFHAYLTSRQSHANVTFNSSDEVLIDGIPSQIAWKNFTFQELPYAKYVYMVERDLDFDFFPEEDIRIYYGLVSQTLLNFQGYARLAEEWSPEFEMLLSAMGLNYIHNLDASEFTIRTSIEFIQKPDGNSICTSFVYVTSKSRQPPLKSFPKGLAPFFYKKHLKIGIYAVAYVFSRIADPCNCLLYLSTDDAKSLNFSGIERELVEVKCDAAKLDIEEKIPFDLSLE